MLKRSPLAVLRPLCQRPYQEPFPIWVKTAYSSTECGGEAETRGPGVSRAALVAHTIAAIPSAAMPLKTARLFFATENAAVLAGWAASNGRFSDCSSE